MTANERKLQILNYIKEYDKEWVTSNDIVENCGMSPKMARKYLKMMADEGYFTVDSHKEGAIIYKRYKLKKGVDDLIKELEKTISEKNNKEKDKKGKEKKKPKTIASDTNVVVEPETKEDEITNEEDSKKEEKEVKPKKLVVKVNSVKVLEVDGVTDINKTCEEILKLHFGEKVDFEVNHEENNICEVNVKMNFGTKG